MDVTLTDVREALLAGWSPEPPDGLAARKAAPLLAATWAELRDVASVGAWSSVIVQTGRLLELCLRAALSDAGAGNPPRLIRHLRCRQRGTGQRGCQRFVVPHQRRLGRAQR